MKGKNIKNKSVREWSSGSGIITPIKSDFKLKRLKLVYLFLNNKILKKTKLYKF